MRSLAGRGRELVDGEALMDGLGALEAVETGAGQDQGVALAFFELAQTRVDTLPRSSTNCEIGPQREQLGAAARAGGADAAVLRQSVQRPKRLADEGVAGIGARRNSGEGEAGVKLGRQVLERMHREIDAAFG